MAKDDDPQDVITPELVLQAYAVGLFPMAEHRHGEMRWVDPERRGIIPLDGFHVSRSLGRTIRKGGFHVTTDTAFDLVVEACGERDETWISGEIARLYRQLFDRGFAHSVEVWDSADNHLFGGVYGVSLGAAFFGESMFSRRTNGSKIALTWLMARLNAGGYRLFDTQFLTDHLASLGGIEVTRGQYRTRLAYAISHHSDWGALSPDASSDAVLHLSTQTS